VYYFYYITLLCFILVNKPVFSNESLDLDMSEEAIINQAKGFYFFNEQRYKESAGEYLKAYKENRGSYKLLEQTAYSLYKAENYDLSRKVFSKAFLLAPKAEKYTLAFYLGLLDYAEKKPELGLKKFKLATKSAEKTGEAYYYLSRIYLANNQVDLYIQALQNAFCTSLDQKTKAELLEEYKTKKNSIPDCSNIDLSKLEYQDFSDTEETNQFNIRATAGLFYDTNVTLNSKDGTSTASNIGSINLPMNLNAEYVIKGSWDVSMSAMIGASLYTKTEAKDYQTLSSGAGLSFSHDYGSSMLDFTYLIDQTWLASGSTFVPYVLGNTLITSYSIIAKKSMLSFSLPIGYDYYQLAPSTSSDQRTGLNLGLGSEYRYAFESLGSIGSGIYATYNNAKGNNKKNAVASADIFYETPSFFNFIDARFAYTFNYYSYFKADPIRADKDNGLSTLLNFYILNFMKSSLEYTYKNVNSNYSSYGYKKHLVGVRLSCAI